MGSPQCYIQLNNTIAANNWKTCGGKINTATPNLQCCADGDYCLSNGLCRYSHSEVGASGYYAGGCTSKDYKDGSCPQLCNAQGRKDVVYASKEKIWSCCGGATNSSTHCDTPTNDNFGAPAMNQLNTIYQAGIGTVSSTISTPPDRNGPGPTPPDRNGPGPTPPPSTTASQTSTMETTTRPRVVVVTKAPTPAAISSKLSTGLAGGLGAGAAVIVLLISGILFWLWRRKRKAKKVEAETTPYTPISGEQAPAAFNSPVTPFAPMAYQNIAPSEIGTKRVRHEMSQDSMRAAELPSSSKGQRLEGMEIVNEIQEMPAADVMARDAGGKR